MTFLKELRKNRKPFYTSFTDDLSTDRNAGTDGSTLFFPHQMNDTIFHGFAPVFFFRVGVVGDRGCKGVFYGLIGYYT